MPFARPTLTALIKQQLSDLASKLQSFVVLRSSPLAKFGQAVAGLVHGLYGYLDWIARQAVPFTATGEFLEAWASLVGVTRKPAAQAGGAVLFSGVPGSIIPEGSAVARSADGWAFVTTALATIGGGGTVSALVAAVEAGAGGNTPDAAPMVLGLTIPGVTSAGEADGPLTGGADLELDDALRDRMLQRYASPPAAGNAADYIRWALEVPGVTRAWCEPLAMGAGSVTVRFMMDDANAAFGGFPQGTDGVATDEARDTPATGDQLTVADHIFPLRPVTALVYAVAPIAHPINVTIDDLAQDTVPIRQAIAASLTDTLRRIGEPGATVYPSDLSGAIGRVAGVTRFTMTSPAVPIALTTGQLPTLGIISYL